MKNTVDKDLWCQQMLLERVKYYENKQSSVHIINNSVKINFSRLVRRKIVFGFYVFMEWL